MAYTDEIRIRINSLFNDAGVEEARKRFQKMKQISNRTGLGMQELQDRMKGTGVAINNAGQMVTASNKDFLNQDKAVRRLTSGYGAMAGMAERSGRSIKGVSQSLEQSRLQLSRNAQGAMMFQNRFTGAMENNRKATKRTRRATATFRMDLLSLMFGFMALRRVMSGLLRPAFKAAGVFETWSTILEILFLPIAIEIQKLLLGLLDVVSGLSRPVKMAIGIITILGVVLLTVGLIATQLGLALSSMGVSMSAVSGVFASAAGLIKTSFLAMSSTVTSVMSTVFATVSSAATAIAGAISLPIIAAIAVVVGAVLLLNEAWANNTGNIREHVGNLATSIADVAPEIGRVLENSMLAPLNSVIEAINAITGKDIDSVSEMFESGGEKLREFGEEAKRQSDEIGGGQGKGFLGFSLTGEGGLLEGGIGGVTSGIGDAMGGMFNFGGPGNISKPQRASRNIKQNNIRQNINVERGSGNKSDFAFSRELGRELEKANKTTLSKQGGTSV